MRQMLFILCKEVKKSKVVDKATAFVVNLETQQSH